MSGFDSSREIVVRLSVDETGSWRWVAAAGDGRQIAVGRSASQAAAHRAAALAFPGATMVIEG